MAKEEIDDRDNHEIVLSELQKYGGRQKIVGEWVMVQCPHPDHPNDKTPSCGVNVSLSNEVKFSYHCFGCNNSGKWSQFAEYANLQPIKEWKNGNIHSGELIDGNMEESLLGSASLTVKGILKQLGVPEAQLWPSNMDWRGFPGNIIRKAGGYIAHDPYNDSIQLVFIVKYAGQVRGGVKAMFEKSKKGQSSYIAMKGAWASKYGLLFFEQARTIMERNGYTFILIVEGPRDALRLLSNGIPAVAVLGAAMMSKSKALMVTALGVDRVYVLPDNDNGGETFWSGAKKVLKPLVPTTLISLPKTDDKGKTVKIDPGNMSLDLLNDLIVMLEKKQDFKRRKQLI